MDRAAADPLQAIRNRIDAIDEEMHCLLIERSRVIAELIRIKGTSRPASAFRPDREADMMRRMAMRHGGELPLVTVEHIWREIITTFTAMQAPFGIAAAPGADPLQMRDLIRFYFGFSVPVAECDSCAEAIGRVNDPGTDIALVPAQTDGRWWGALAGAEAPKVFAKLPFIETPDRPAALPAYVVGLPLRETAPPDVRLLVFSDSPTMGGLVEAHGGKVTACAGGEILVELPVAVSPDELARQAGETGQVRHIGGFAQPIKYVSERVT